jgi:hypothetical protein
LVLSTAVARGRHRYNRNRAALQLAEKFYEKAPTSTAGVRMIYGPGSHRLVVATVLSVSAAALSAQPRIDQVQNNYSYLLPGNPNYGIAQGSIFIVKGANLANTSTGLQNTPLKTRWKVFRRRSP